MSVLIGQSLQHRADVALLITQRCPAVDGRSDGGTVATGESDQALVGENIAELLALDESLRTQRT